MQAVEEVEAKRDIVPDRVRALAEEAKARVAQFAASLVEPDVAASRGDDA